MVAVPRPDGHVVLDMAMSQFSFGSPESYKKRDEPLPCIQALISTENLLVTRRD